MIFPSSQLNYLAILVSTIVAFFIGFMWYGPIFGKPWRKEMKINPKDMNNKEGLGKLMIINIIGTLVMIYVLANFVGLLNISNFIEGIQLGFWIWLGFFASTTLLGSVLWEMKSWKLYSINAAYWLVNLTLNAGILAVWK